MKSVSLILLLLLAGCGEDIRETAVVIERTETVNQNGFWGDPAHCFAKVQMKDGVSHSVKFGDTECQFMKPGDTVAIRKLEGKWYQQ